MAWQINFVGTPNQCIATMNNISTNGTQIETDQLNTARTAITAEIIRLKNLGVSLMNVVANGAFNTTPQPWSEVNYMVQPVLATVGNERVLPPN